MSTVQFQFASLSNELRPLLAEGGQQSYEDAKLELQSVYAAAHRRYEAEFRNVLGIGTRAEAARQDGRDKGKPGSALRVAYIKKTLLLMARLSADLAVEEPAPQAATTDLSSVTNEALIEEINRRRATLLPSIWTLEDFRGPIDDDESNEDLNYRQIDLLAQKFLHATSKGLEDILGQRGYGYLADRWEQIGESLKGEFEKELEMLAKPSAPLSRVKDLGENLTQALRAIRARIHGDLDHPDLETFVPLSANWLEDVQRIIEGTMRSTEAPAQNAEASAELEALAGALQSIAGIIHRAAAAGAAPETAGSYILGYIDQMKLPEQKRPTPTLATEAKPSPSSDFSP